MARWLHHNADGRPYSLRQVAGELRLSRIPDAGGPIIGSSGRLDAAAISLLTPSGQRS